MSDHSVTCFGVGDGAACADRGHAAHLYRLGDRTLLIDCGEPVSQRYKSAGLSTNLVDAILLSHRHFDHVGGLFMLLQGWWLDGRKKGLNVHMPTFGIQPLRDLLQNSLFIDEQLPFKLDFKPLTGGAPTRFGDVKVTPFHTTHMNRMQAAMPETPSEAFECFCFLIETGGLRIGHSADLGSPADLDPLLRQPLDLLICELSHFQPSELFDFLEGKPIKQLALVHLGGQVWTKRDELRELAARRLPDVDVLIPNDGDTLSV